MRTPKIGIRDFRSGFAEFIAAAMPVAVTRHGRTVAYFIPTSAESGPDLATLKQALGSLEVVAVPGIGAGRRKTTSKKRVAQVKQNRKNG